MTKIKALLLFLISFVLCVSCSPKNDPLIGTWEFVSVHEENFVNDYDYSSFKSLITLSGDQTFLFMDEGKFDPINSTAFAQNDSISGNQEKPRVYSGNWTKKDSILHFRISNYKKKRDFRVKIVSNDGKNMGLVFLKSSPNQDKSIAKFKYKKIDYDDISQTDFQFTSSELNKWRVKNFKKSSKKEIKAKTENALQFAITFLEYHEKTAKVAGTHYLEPLPFRFYSNGIVLKNKDKAYAWGSLFYDDEDFNSSYSIIESSFKSVAKVPKEISKSPIKINIYILQEILKNLKETNI